MTLDFPLLESDIADMSKKSQCKLQLLKLEQFKIM